MRKALRLGGDTHSLEDVIEALDRGEMQAHHNDRAIIITEIVQSPRRKYAHFFLSAGQLDGIMDLMPQVEKWALEQGCEYGQACVRPGYEPVLKARGWKRRMIMMEYHPHGQKRTECSDGHPAN
jgi:hypothetical protein